jgi:hypothetical protein
MSESTPPASSASSEPIASAAVPLDSPEAVIDAADTPPRPAPTEAGAASCPAPDAAAHDPVASPDPAPSPAASATAQLLAATTPSVDPLHAAVSAAEALSMGLSPAQRTAIEKLTTGHTLIASATAAGVSRVTLYRWLKHDLTFLAAYNAWQHDAIATARARLLALTDTAVTTVQNSIVKGDGRLALNLLIHLGIADRPTPGPTEVDELEAEESLSRQRQEIDRRKEADRVEWERILLPPSFSEGGEESEPEDPIRVRYKRME